MFHLTTRLPGASRPRTGGAVASRGQANQMAETLCPLERLRFSAEVLTERWTGKGWLTGIGRCSWNINNNIVNSRKDI